MKTTVTLVLLLAYGLPANAQKPELEVSMKSRIEHVTVFLEGAQITRLGTAALKPGVSMLTFDGISPAIQEQSIQVEASTSVKILSVSFNVNYLEEMKVPEKITVLEDERRRLWASLAQEKSLEEVYREEEAILKTNKSIGGTSNGVPIDELKIAMEYFRERLMNIKQQLLHAERNIKDYNERIGKIDAQLRGLSAVKAQPIGQIVVKVATKTMSTVPITLKYLVEDARWFPSYDIRAKNIQSPITITYKANVMQQTGEDWTDVRLTISSGNPNQTGARPIIKPWILGFNNTISRNPTSMIGTIAQDNMVVPSSNAVRGRIVDELKKGLPGVNVVIKGTTIGTVTDAHGYYTIPLTPDAKTLVFSFVGYETREEPIQGRTEIDAKLSSDVTSLSEVVVTAYGTQRMPSVTGSVATVDKQLQGSLPGVITHTPRVKKSIVATPVIKQTNFEFALDELFSVKSDGELRTTDMVEYELDALFEYYCAPKLDPDAFLVAKVLHWDEHNFLEGEANLFFEGKYIGKSVLDTRHTSDTLTISLGRDGNVLVKREKEKELTSRHLVASHQKSTIGYEISIRNKKAEQLTIVIEDQIPIANDKEISIDKMEDSSAEYNSETGGLKWRKQIDPGKTESFHFRYAVRYPKNSSIVLE